LDLFLNFTMKKICTKCKILKSSLEFHPRKDSPDGYRNDCKKCVRKRQNKYNSKNSEQRKDYMKEYNNKILDLCCIKCKLEFEISNSCVSKKTNYFPCDKCQLGAIFENFTIKYLIKNSIKFQREKNLNGRYFDFYIAKNNLLIEIDENYHLSKKQKEIDLIKTEIANSLNYKLLRISVNYNNVLNSYKKIVEECQRNIQ